MLVVAAVASAGVLGAHIGASANAHAEPAAAPSPSYELGYTKAVNDIRIMASRMRAEGFDLAEINVANRIPALCAKESAAMRTGRDGSDGQSINGPEFLRGCTDGLNSVVRGGTAY
ncbi:hypothetical protein A5634_20480 [Mycobacterium asiaticum]|uniref:DUF732 domain-containing protein n=2 Tax=Mycobacterium asiaticum TaxID=1790 RepID=A0A1A3P473_MYCAS|nr:hypothetical protein A5634_20480 [Mycobacterium asiaticum]